MHKNTRRSLRLHALAVAPILTVAGCIGADAPADADEHVESTAEPLIGQVLFPDTSCTADEQAFILEAIRRGRTIAESSAYETCVRDVMAAPTDLSGDPHLARAVQGVPGPYDPCTGDPTLLDPIGTVLGYTRDNLGVSITCTPVGTGAYAFSTVTTDPGANETLTMLSKVLDVAIASSDQNIVAAAVWHEAMHQHGFTHGGGPAEQCGYAAGTFSDDDATWFTRHTVPFLVDGCMAYLADLSDICRSSMTCKPDEVAIRTALDPNASCACAHDPGWHEINNLAMGQASVARDNAGDLAVAALAYEQDYVKVTSQTTPNGTSFAPWTDMNGTARQVELAADQDGRLEVFAIGFNGALYHAWQNASRVWGTWAGLGRTDITQIAVSNAPDGSLYAFALTNAGSVVVTTQNGPNGGWSGAWTSLGGTALTSIRVGRNADGRPEVFAVGGNKALYHQWQWGGTTTWSGWQSLGRSDVDQVAVANEGDGTLSAYVRAGGAVYATSQTGPNGSWPGAWTPLWGSGISYVAAGSGGDGRVRVFAVGGDFQAYVTAESSPKGPFNSWTLIPGSATYTQLAVGIDQAGRTNLFGIGTDLSLTQVAVP